MTTLNAFEKHAHIHLDKHTGQFLVIDKRHAKNHGEKIEVAQRHAMDLSKQYGYLERFSREYIVELEGFCVSLIKELFAAKGLTATDDGIRKRLNDAGVTKYQRVFKI